MARTRMEGFDGSSASGRAARGFVAAVLDDWDHRGDAADDALLCIGELAANAVLHGRGAFRVRVSELGDGGLRVEVLDNRPADVPIAFPTGGSAASVVAKSTTGRGLQMVASVATRWGVSTEAKEKSVWAEIGGDAPETPTDPVLDLHDGPSAPQTARRTVRLLDVPVQRAIASGMQVDELVREFQLGLFDGAVSAAEREAFYELLDRSAPARLAGRRAALDASACGETRFDLNLPLAEDLFNAVFAFRELLETVPHRQPSTSAAPPRDVVEFRDWINEEITSQLAGNAPSPCELD